MKKTRFTGGQTCKVGLVRRALFFSKSAKTENLGQSHPKTDFFFFCGLIEGSIQNLEKDLGATSKPNHQAVVIV